MTKMEFRAHIRAKQSAIIFESADDEGAADYSGELQSILDVIDKCGDLAAIEAACNWVGESFLITNNNINDRSL